MKMKISLLAILLLSSTSVYAAQQTIAGGTGVTWGTEKGKLNGNFTELYGWVDQGVKTTSNPAFNSVNLSSGNVAANNVQVVKAWTTGLQYTDDVTAVIHSGNIYVCTSTHTAGSTTEPGTGASWGTVWKFWGADIYQSLMGSDDNYVTDAEKTKLSNLSGTNTGDQAASGVSFTPNGTIAATTVQAAIQEVRDEAGASGATAINDLTDVDTTGKATGKVLKFDASGNMVVGDDEIGAAGTGDITGVTAGTGLTGGGDTGALTIGLSSTTTDAIAANTAKVSFDATSSARLANTSGTNTGDQTPTSLGLVIGTNVQAFDADLTDLADGSLTGSKVGIGISGDNVTAGTVADARIASTIARDTEIPTTLSQLIDDVGIPQAAIDMSFTPDGSISSTNLQTAIMEVRNEAAPTASPTFTGTITVPALSGATYTGTSLVSAVQAALTANDNAVDINASTYMLTVLDDADAATARATLGAAAALGTDDNYATDAEKVKLGNLSGTNTGDQVAGGVAFTPNGTIAATTVQAAIQEVRDEASSSVDLSAPGPIGATTPSTAAFTTVSADDIIIAPPPSGETGEIGLKEAPANGTNEVILKAPAALAANVTITLPTGTVPASATATCTAGQWWFDTSYWYVCVATNTWRRVALATW